MLIDLGFSPDQEAIHDSVRRFCEQEVSRAGIAAKTFSRALWSRLAELGVLTLRPMAGDALNLLAAVEPLGRAGFAGPLAATEYALAILPEQEAQAVSEGTKVVALGRGGLFPFGNQADLLIEMRLDGPHRVSAESLHTLSSLTGDIWVRADSVAKEAFPDAEGAQTVYDLTVAAYLCGAGRQLVDIAAEHARNRRQFGKTLGEFQAVAFPLALILSDLTAAWTTTLVAAYKLDEGAAHASYAVHAARLLSSRAARRAAFSAHQTLGASGTLEDGTILHLTRRIQQVVLEPPTDRDAQRAFTAGGPAALDALAPLQ